jgi:geranylgeranyl pyrophosphate synthase
MTPSTTLLERRGEIDRRLETALERADEHSVALAASTVDACPDRWYGQLVALSHAAIADKPASDAILSASAAVELLRGYCRLRTELLIQLADNRAHSLTGDPANALLAGDYLNSAAYTALAEAGNHHLEDALQALIAVSESLVDAFDAKYVRSVDDHSFLDDTVGSIGEGAAVIGITLAGGDTTRKEDFATLGRGFSTAYQIRRILNADSDGAVPTIAPPRFDTAALRQHGARHFREATHALGRLSDSADVEPLRNFVNTLCDQDNGF